MKTHEVAKALTLLSKLLRSMPNEEIESLGSLIEDRRQRDTAEIAVSLATLASLASYGKTEWIGVINDFQLPIEIRPRDAARDVLGKLLSYLEDNKDAREKLTRDARLRSKSSNEVSSALQFLLRNG